MRIGAYQFKIKDNVRSNLKIIKKVIFNIPLLVWFFLDMTGMIIGDKVLVSQAYKDDGIFFAMYVVALIGFMCLKGRWKIVLPVWLSIWLVGQIKFHWCVTMFGPWEGKNRYFENTIKLINHQERYIPDLYHIVLHILILVALVSSIGYFRNSHK